MKQYEKRISVGVDEELNERLEKLREERYKDASWSEMLRNLVRLGLDTMAEEEK